MLDAMSGPVLGDFAWAPPLPAGETFLQAADRAPGRLRIGRYQESPMPGIELEPEVAEAFEDAGKLLESLGHDVEDVPSGLLGPEVLPSFERVWALSGTLLPVPPARVGELRPLTRELRGRGLAMSAQDRHGGDDRAAAVRPPVPPGHRRLRRPAGAGHHDDAAAARAGSTPTATAPRTSSGTSGTPRSPRSSTSPGSRR